MNPAEQHAHRTVTAKLETRVRALEHLVDLQARALAQFLPATAEALDALGRAIATLEGTTTAARHEIHNDLLLGLLAHARRTPRQRLVWLLTGR